MPGITGIIAGVAAAANALGFGDGRPGNIFTGGGGGGGQQGGGGGGYTPPVGPRTAAELPAAGQTQQGGPGPQYYLPPPVPAEQLPAAGSAGQQGGGFGPASAGGGGGGGFQPALFGGGDDDPFGGLLDMFGGNGGGDVPLEDLDLRDRNPIDGRTVDDEALNFLMLFGKNLRIPAGIPLRYVVRNPVVFKGPQGAVRLGSVNGFRLVRKTYKGRLLVKQVWKPIADQLEKRRPKPLVTAAEKKVVQKAARVEKKIKKVTQELGFHVYDEARPMRREHGHEHEHHTHHTHHTTHHHD